MPKCTCTAVDGLYSAELAHRPECPLYPRLKTHHDTIRDAIAGVLAHHNVHVEQLTSLQLAEAIRQALAAGDFMRHVTVDGRQAVTYVPYRERDSLLAKLAYAKAALNRIFSE